MPWCRPQLFLGHSALSSAVPNGHGPALTPLVLPATLRLCSDAHSTAEETEAGRGARTQARPGALRGLGGSEPRWPAPPLFPSLPRLGMRLLKTTRPLFRDDTGRVRQFSTSRSRTTTDKVRALPLGTERLQTWSGSKLQARGHEGVTKVSLAAPPFLEM